MSGGVHECGVKRVNRPSTPDILTELRPSAACRRFQLIAGRVVDAVGVDHVLGVVTSVILQTTVDTQRSEPIGDAGGVDLREKAGLRRRIGAGRQTETGRCQ